MKTYTSFEDNELITQLRNGAIGVIPTDTVYGLVCDAKNIEACSKLYGLKDRTRDPGTLIASNVNQLVELGLKKRYLAPIEEYWPGPISVIIPTSSSGLDYLHLGKKSLAVRIPAKEELLSLLDKSGCLLTTSANLPGQPPATNIAEIKNYFKDKLDYIVDIGELKSEPSTIIKVVDDAIVVLRKGLASDRFNE